MERNFYVVGESSTTAAARNDNRAGRRGDSRPTAPPLRPRIQQPELLFSERLGRKDADPDFDRLVIGDSDVLMAALKRFERQKVVRNGDFLEVVTTDTNGVNHELRLTTCPSRGRVLLCYGWGEVVIANELRREDTVEGWGYRLRGTGDFRLKLYLIKGHANAT